MEFTLRVTTDNDAFAEDLYGEISRILDITAEEVRELGMIPGEKFSIRDANGNTCGRYGLVEQ